MGWTPPDGIDVPKSGGVDHHVAVTSTLPVFEPWSPHYRPLPPKQLDVMSPEARTDYFYVLQLFKSRPPERQAAAAKQ